MLEDIGKSFANVGKLYTTLLYDRYMEVRPYAHTSFLKHSPKDPYFWRNFFKFLKTLRYKWAKLQLQHSKMAKWDASCIPICMYDNKADLYFYMFTSLLKIEVFNQQKIDQSHPKLHQSGPLV